MLWQKNWVSDITLFYLAGVILIKKAGDGSKKIKGCWDSIHVVEVVEKSSGRSAHYKLTSTAMLWLQTNKQGSGTMNLGGSLTRQVTPKTFLSPFPFTWAASPFPLHIWIHPLVRSSYISIPWATHSLNSLSCISSPIRNLGYTSWSVILSSLHMFYFSMEQNNTF